MYSIGFVIFVGFFVVVKYVSEVFGKFLRDYKVVFFGGGLVVVGWVMLGICDF